MSAITSPEKLQLLIHPGDVVHRAHSPEHRREAQLSLTLAAEDLFPGHWHVGSAEVHRSLSHLTDATARTDGLVVDLHSRVFCCLYSVNHLE